MVAQIRQSHASLFYGAGVTCGCGGPTWDELFSTLKSKFSGGRSNKFFDYVQEIVGYDDSNRAEVEDLIRNRLASVSPRDEQKYLFSIPWKAVLTTNYDHLPESVSTSLDGSRQIVSISDPGDQIDQTKGDYLYCFKLLGDCRYNYPQGGWMVLSSTDLFAASERRSIFFRKFRNLASTGHLVYLGCSFKDDLVFNILYHMKIALQVFPWKGFAVMKSEPDEETKKKLEQVGITVIHGTLEDFIAAAKKALGEKPSSAPATMRSITVHRQTIEPDRSTLSNIWRKFSVLHDELMRYSSERPIDFFSGICQSLYPYVMNWDFGRRAELIWSQKDKSVPRNLADFKDKASSSQLSDNVFVALVGIAGSGKTVMANRLAFEWYQTGNPVIYVNSENLSIDTDALNGLIEDIRDKYLQGVEQSEVKNPRHLRWLVIADECGSLLPDLRMLKNYLMSTGRPGDLILVSRETEAPIERLKSSGLDAVYRIDDTVHQDQRELFYNYLKRYGVIEDESLISANFQDSEINSSFFALIYSTIRDSRKTMKRLLEEEYVKLDEDSKQVYRTVSVIQSFRLQPLLSLVLKSQSSDQNWLDHEARIGRLSGVLRFVDYGNALVTVNRVVAEAISDIVFRNSEERRRALEVIISKVTVGDTTEMQLLENLLNRRIELDIGPRLAMADKISLFRSGIKVVRSRPLLIHLGRLLTNAQDFPNAAQALREAHDAHVPGFEEIHEHVLDAEGRLELARAETEASAGRIENAWDHLELAEAKFLEAQIDPRRTPHPYEGLARVYLSKARVSDDEGIRWQFILAGMQEANYVEDYLGETSDIALLKLEIENILSQVGFNESHIGRIQDRIGKANGYAYLAENEIVRGRFERALELVETGLRSEAFSIWLMRLRVRLLRRLSPDNHSTIMETLDDYASVSDERYDITLSFELAKEEYMSGKVRDGRRMFRDLFTRAKHHPRRLIPRDPEDRWIEQGRPKRLTGTIKTAPTEERYGYVETTFPTNRKDALVIRRKDLQFQNPRPGDRVSYEIVFNMLGPEASRVRKI